MDAEFLNRCKVARDKLGLPLDNSQVEQFAARVLGALPAACLYEQPSRLRMFDRGEIAVELNLGRRARATLVAQIVDEVVNPPRAAPAPETGMVVTAVDRESPP